MADDGAPRKFSKEEELAHNAACEKEIDLCHETINKNQEDYDKQLLTLASGFLALVVAFVKDIVPLETAAYAFLFYGALATLLLCILCVLFSYQLSICGHYKAKEFWEKKRCGADNSGFPYRFADRVRRVNVISGILFLLGIIFLVTFIVLNVVRERSMTERRHQFAAQTVQKGANLKAPAQAPAQGGFERGAHLKVPASVPAPATQTQQGGSGGGQTGKP